MLSIFTIAKLRNLVGPEGQWIIILPNSTTQYAQSAYYGH